MMTIGDVLKSAREQLGLSQEKVATRIRKNTGSKFSRAALAQIESGSTKQPTPINLQAACDALKIDFRSALKGMLIWIDIESNNGQYSKRKEELGRYPYPDKNPERDNISDKNLSELLANASPRTRAVLETIEQADKAGRLTDDDAQILQMIAKRLTSDTPTKHLPEPGYGKLLEEAKNNHSTE